MFAKHACTIPAALWLVGACSVYDPSLLSTNQGVGADEGGSAGTFGGVGASASNGGSAAAIGGATSGVAGAAGTSSAGAGGVLATAGVGGAHAGAGGFVNGGGTASAGTAGSDGAAAGGSAGSGALALDLIDDMEDDDAVIDYEDGRDGDWYVGHDATAGGTQFPGINFEMSALDQTDSRYAVSKFAAMTKGQGFTDWGENMGFNMKLVDQTLGKHPPYDASKYCGLHFYGHVGSGASSEVIFRVPDKNSHPDGGVCGAADKPCYIPFQKQLTFSTDWKEYSILFTDLTRTGWGPLTFDVSAIYGVEFGLLPNTKFELWIDDISFFVKPASGVCPTTL